jgi:hypothetical protein
MRAKYIGMARYDQMYFDSVLVVHVTMRGLCILWLSLQGKTSERSFYEAICTPIVQVYAAEGTETFRMS